MDVKDEQIIKILTHDSSLSTKEISRKTGIPITTVHHRIKKMVADGTIKQYTIKVDDEKVGLPITAYALITLDFTRLNKAEINQHEVLRRLLKHPNVEGGHVVTGETDIVVRVRVKSLNELDLFLTQFVWGVTGVGKTQTMVCLRGE
ncbi:Lrp/AsnC family transcriptional regulator [Candidatus Woesearchaeota archaeon]|nr:Lrp/AsnC family transcriptional regulator [Candidatus Woesearchaeota archaeon]